jgi:integrase
MTIRIETPRNGKARYDILTLGPEGPVRERRNFPEALKSPSARMRWAQERERHLTREGPDVEEVEAPTLREFGERWMEEYARANGNKPSTLAAKETILRLHLLPVLGSFRLNEIGPAAVQRLKLSLDGKVPKTKACVLSQLATILRTAERWEEILKAPHIDLPSIPSLGMDFYGFEEWELLVQGAEKAGPMQLAAILLGGEAGLRRGELVALEQSDCGSKAVQVQRNEWEGHVGTTKGNKARRVPMTKRLQEAIAAVRHLRGKRLLWQAKGEPV